MQRYDAAIIGAGPAGLEAAINLRIRNKTFILFGADGMSEKIRLAPKIENYLGLPGVTGHELYTQLQEHLARMDIAIQHERIQMLYPMGAYFSLASAKTMYEATTVILAPGVHQAKSLPGEQEFLGKGVGYCATCDAPLYRGKTVAILGYTKEAVHEANYLAGIAAKTYYLPMKALDVQPDAAVEALSGKVEGIAGDTAVRSLQVDGRSFAVDGVFILRESVAPASLLPGLAVQDGYIQVDLHMQTNIPGCFAAGDCTGKPHQYMRAAGQGQTAALNAVTYLDHLTTKGK